MGQNWHFDKKQHFYGKTRVTSFKKIVDKVCKRKVCVNDNGHAKSFSNICEANKYLKKHRKTTL